MKIIKYKDLILMIADVWKEGNQKVLRLRHPHFKGIDWYFVPLNSFNASEFLKDEPYFWKCVNRRELTWEILEERMKELQSKSPYLAIRAARRFTPIEDSNISYLLQTYQYSSIAEGILKLLNEPFREERYFGISPIEVPDIDLWKEHLDNKIEDKPENTVSLVGWITLNELRREIEQIRENKSNTVYDLPESINDGDL